MSRTGHRAYRRNRGRLKRSPGGDICWLCGQPINMDLVWPDPWSWSADHVTEIKAGGHNLGPLRPAHWIHNQQRNRQQTTAKPTRHGRSW